MYRERGITPGNYGAGLKRPGYGEQPATLDEMIARVAELPLAYEPGTVLHYSIGFDVMALVIQRVTGMPYDAFLREISSPCAVRIAEQLGVGGEQLIKRVLGHADGSVTAIYNRYGYGKEMREVLERWAEDLIDGEWDAASFWC